VDLGAIVKQLRAERDRLDEAITAISQLGTSQLRPQRGRKATPHSNANQRKRRRFSAAARKRLSEAMKKRWAARKNTQRLARRVARSKKVRPKKVKKAKQGLAKNEKISAPPASSVTSQT